MPCYCYKCHACDETKEVVRLMVEHDRPEICDCGKRMKRDYVTEHHAVRGNFKQPIVSDSMAFNTQDIVEHRRRFPNIDLKVDKAGQTAYPIFHSRGQKKSYMKGRGWHDNNSFDGENP